MNTQELEAALTQIVANHSIVCATRCGDIEGTMTVTPSVKVGSRGEVFVTLETNYTITNSVCVETLVAVRRELADMEEAGKTFRRRKLGRAGFWHMGSFCTTSMTSSHYPQNWKK